MKLNSAEKRKPLGIGYYCEGWPKDFVPNGIITYVANSRQALENMGAKVYVVVNRTPLGLGSKTVKVIKHECGTRVPEAIAEAAEKLIRAKKIEIFEMEETCGWAHGVARRLLVPLIVKIHGPWFLNGKALGIPEDKYFTEITKDELRGMQSAAGITAPSQDVLKRTQDYYGVTFKNAKVIPYPVRTIQEKDRWQLARCDKKKILFVGRFDAHKGADVLIEAFATIVKKMPEVELLFVGPDRGLNKDGKCWRFQDYVNRVIPSQFRRNIRWLGKLPLRTIEALRRKAFLTIIASRYENFGNVVLESMSHGCPTLASNVGGNPEIIENGLSGLLFEAENPADLAAKALNVLGDESLAERFGKQAAETMTAKYHPEKIASQMMDYYAGFLR